MLAYNYLHYSYRLRSGGAIPVQAGSFLAQTFGVDRSRIFTWEATTILPKTNDFMGANPTATYMQASFQRLPYLSESGEQLFSGSITEKPDFVDEDQMPGQGGI
jgi:hypothetical protein